jgi:hypothetical protein
LILILKTSTIFREKPTILKQRFLLNEKTVDTLITLGVSMDLGARQLKNASIAFLAIAQAYFK